MFLAQAIDRVHRLGQNNPVEVIRMCTTNTIERRVVALQEKKKIMIKAALAAGVQKELPLPAGEIFSLLNMKCNENDIITSQEVKDGNVSEEESESSESDDSDE